MENNIVEPPTLSQKYKVDVNKTVRQKGEILS